MIFTHCNLKLKYLANKNTIKREKLYKSCLILTSGALLVAQRSMGKSPPEVEGGRAI